MQKAGGVSRVQDCSDVNVTLGAGVDGYSITYDHASGKFVLSSVSGVGISKIQDADDVNFSLGAGVDGYTVNYDHGIGKFVLTAPVVPDPPGISNIQDAGDVNFSLGAGVDEYAICWDNNTSKFVLRAVAVGSFLLSSGATDGAVDQAQAFTSGVKTGLVFPSADKETAIKLAKANGSTAVLTVDTSNNRIGINKTPAYDLDVYGVVKAYKPNTHDVFIVTSTLGYRGYSVFVAGESQPRFYNIAHALWFGGGASAVDVTLGRYAAGVLKINGNGAVGSLVISGNFGVGIDSPTVLVDFSKSDAVTKAVTNVLTVRHASSGTPAAGFGVALTFALESTTTENQSAGRVYAVWSEATHATRKAQVVFTAYDTAEREGIRIGANGSRATIGFLGATPSAQLAHVADVKGDYAAGDLDSEAEVISMANALAAAINSLNALVETFGLRASS